MFFQSHLNSAVLILQSYNGTEPFHLFIKRYFSLRKKFGSKDRKQIASLCYNYFRLGHAAKKLDIQERILLGTFLCESKNSEMLYLLKPEWNSAINKSLKEKLEIINKQFNIENIFPFKKELSDGMDAEKFDQSFLIQPKLFLRIRPGNKNKITGKLAGASIEYQLLTETCIGLSNSAKVNSVIELDKEAVVQDYNSQQILNILKHRTSNIELQTSIWDCCAASGGKSIMVYDLNSNIQLTVSDKRESILQNLHQRFKKAGIKNYNSFVADLSSLNVQTASGVQTGSFDFIIADVPCTGSGTWSRTPEQLYFFKEEKISEYSSLQKKIIENVIPQLKEGGYLLYITCSVFKKENEEIVNFIKEKFHLSLIKMELLKGYEMQADTMFAALFKDRP